MTAATGADGRPPRTDADGGESFAMRRSLKTTLVGCAAVPGLLVLMLPLVTGWVAADRDNFWIDAVLLVATLGYGLVVYAVVDYLRDRPALTVTADRLTRHLPSFLPWQDRTVARADIVAVVRFDFPAVIPFLHAGLPHYLACELATGERVRLTENEDLAAVRATTDWLLPRLGGPLRVVAPRWGEMPPQEQPPYRSRYAAADPRVRFPASRVLSGHAVTLSASPAALVCEQSWFGRREVRRWPGSAVRAVSASLALEQVPALQQQDDPTVCVALAAHLADGSVVPLVSVRVSNYEQAEELAWVATVLRRQLPKVSE